MDDKYSKVNITADEFVNGFTYAIAKATIDGVLTVNQATALTKDAAAQTVALAHLRTTTTTLEETTNG